MWVLQQVVPVDKAVAEKIVSFVSRHFVRLAWVWELIFEGDRLKACPDPCLRPTRRRPDCLRPTVQSLFPQPS